MITIRKELNSERTGLGHQHGHRLVVLANGRGFSSLIAAEGRFAKRPSAAISERKRLPFAGYNMAAVTSCENPLYGKKKVATRI